MDKLSDKNMSGFLNGIDRKNWTTTTIGKVVEIYSGGTPATEIAEYWDGDIPWCTPTDITRNDAKYISQTERNISYSGLKHSAAILMPKGSLLLCSRATIGEVKIAGCPIATNQGFKNLICHDNIDVNFMYYLLKTLKRAMFSKANGSTFLEISKSQLASIEIEIPSYTVQNDIANVLVSIDEEIHSLKLLFSKYESIKKATVKKLMTPTSEWREARLGDFYTVSSGLSKGAASFGSGYPFLSFVTVFNNPIVPEKLDDLVESSEYERRQYSVKRGDVFLTRTSETLDELGMSSVALQNYSEATFNGFTKRLRPVDGIPLCPEFMAFYLRTDNFRSHICQKAAITTRASLNKNTIEKLAISYPSPTVQREISAHLISFDNQHNNLFKELNKLQQLKQSMLQYFFGD